MLYRFGDFELDTAKAELRGGGQPRPVERQVFAVLALLVENGERLISKDEIIEKVWEGRIVSDAAVASRIKSARQALGDDGKAQRYIKTIHGRGFRFAAAVTRAPDARPSPEAEVPAPPDSARPSIAVLPFRLIGETGRHATVADALPHELIAELSRLRWLFVTARASSFRLRAPDPDIREVGRLLGVRYGLTGTVEVGGSYLTVTVELTDTRDGGVVWADRFQSSLDAVHEVRAEIRSSVLAALEIHIPAHEASRARLGVTEDLDAWSAYHLGLQHLYCFNRKDNASAAGLFQLAVARDPAFARAHAGLSFVHFQTAFLRHTDDLTGATEAARRSAARAVELDPLDPFVNFTMGRTFWLTGELEDSLPWLERSTSISPSYAQGIYARAWTETLSGRCTAGRAHADLAMRLSPLDPLYYGMVGTRAFTHMALGEDIEAAAWSERAARSPGAHALIAMIAAAAHALAGDETRATAWAANVRERHSALTREDFFRAFPMRDAGMRNRVSLALARCGF